MLYLVILIVGTIAAIAYHHHMSQFRGREQEPMPSPEKLSSVARVRRYPDLPFARPKPSPYDDPRVITPSLATVPDQLVDFPYPQLMGTFGMTDAASPVWKENYTNLVADGEIVEDESFLPSAQLNMVDKPPVTTLPIRFLQPQPYEYDLVESGLSSLGGGPASLVDARLTPPGTARPMSEWAWINYGSE